MKIIEPSAVLVKDFDGAEIMKFLERCGRTAYQSEKNITETSAENFIRNIIKRGHESVLEHFSCTFKIICDRGVMAELTRHRHASFTIESTRFNDYSSKKFDGELTFIRPQLQSKTVGLNEETYDQALIKNKSFFVLTSIAWKANMRQLEKFYKTLRESDISPEQARAILPNSLKTEIVMTANLREWRHVLKLRTAKDAHPQMRQIAFIILDVLKRKLPVIFEDIGG